MHKVLLVQLLALVGGCAANRVDLTKANQLSVSTSSTKSVIVPDPSVWQEDGHTRVYGHVRRAPGAQMVGAGHTHVRVQLAGSGIVEEQWVPWSPKWIPFRGPRYSTYAATYPWVIPAGSSVRVWVCFDEHSSIPGGNAPATSPTTAG